jgi:CHAD domain-containing protein
MEDASRSDDHHNLRIRFKRMRYAVELADELLALESDPKDILQHAKRLQDALGILNDGHDLVDFMRRPEVMQILGRFEQPLEDEARRIVRRRYKTAHHLVADRGARIVGEVRRAAGLIGRFQPAVS